MMHQQLGEAAYRAHPFVANSTLSRIKSPWLNVAAFRIGTLIHSVTLESKNVDYIRGTIVGHPYEYSAEEINLAIDMRRSFMADDFCRMLISTCSVEVEMYNENTQFDDIAINTKRKYDLWNYASCWGGDLKSTTATTLSEFLQHVDHFDYDRGRVFYAKGSGAKQDVIIGVGKKKPYPIFKVVMKEGDELWTRGLAKCNALAKQYHELNPPF